MAPADRLWACVMKTMWRRLVWGGVVGALALVVGAGEVAACGNAMRHERARMADVEAELPAPVLVARAQQLLEEGDLRGAMRLVVRAYPTLAKLDEGYKHPERFKPNAADEAARRTGEGFVQAARVAALVVVRSRGQVRVDLKASIHDISAKQTLRQLTWAVAVWRHAVAQDGTRADWRGYLGEALAAHPKHRAEAAEVLAALEGEGVLSERGAALLRSLREEQEQAQAPAAQKKL